VARLKEERIKKKVRKVREVNRAERGISINAKVTRLK